MKAKLIIIAYLNNGNMKSQVAKEFMFNRVVNDLIGEGRGVAHTAIRPMDKRVTFEDGTKVTCIPFSMNQRGMKATEIFIDDELLKMPNGRQAVIETFGSSLLLGEYENYDTSGKNRINSYHFEENSITLSPLS